MWNPAGVTDWQRTVAGGSMNIDKGTAVHQSAAMPEDAMDIDKAIALTQDRLAEEGGTMGDLLGHFRNRISSVLIGDLQWERILDCARQLPITIGTLPFGFELPLHERRPEADLAFQ